MTDCFINNLLYELYYEGWLEFSVSNNKTTTSTVAKIIGNGLYNSGYAPDMPCIFHLFANRTVPNLDLSPYGSNLYIDFDLQMECNKNITDDFTFYQVATVQWTAQANMTLDVTDNITLTGNMNSLNLNIDGYYNATVKVSLTKIKLELIAVETFVKLLINGLINPGISLNDWLSTHTMLRFFNLTEMEIIVEEDYLMVGLTPQFDHRKV